MDLMQSMHSDFESLRCSEESLSPLIPSAERSYKSERGVKSKLAGLPRIFRRRERGYLQRKERYARQSCAKKRVKLNYSRQENEENLPGILNKSNSSGEIAREGASNLQLNSHKRRRMATCEQIEKVTRLGSLTLYELRKALVVIKRLENYGLL